jgi:hypothetical protein
MRHRKAQISAINRSSQTLKVVLKEKDEQITSFVLEIKELGLYLTKQLRTFKVEREFLTVNKEKCDMRSRACLQKLRGWEKEQNRIKKHKGEMVDTQMWSEGILQRTGTKALRNHLEEEIRLSTLQGQTLAKELEGHRDAVLECSTKLERVKCDGDKISIAVRVMERYVLYM